LHEANGNMRALGISLIVAGLALVCGALILWPRASRTEEEEKTERGKDGDGRSVVARVASARALLLPVNLCCGATGISDQKYALGALGWGVAQMLTYRVYVVDAEGRV
jgi:hypothetical protein